MLRGVAGFGGEDSEIINATDFSTSRLFGFHDAPSFAGSLLEICYGSMDILFLPRRTLFLEGSSNPGIFAELPQRVVAVQSHHACRGAGLVLGGTSIFGDHQVGFPRPGTLPTGYGGGLSLAAGDLRLRFVVVVVVWGIAGWTGDGGMVSGLGERGDCGRTGPHGMVASYVDGASSHVGLLAPLVLVLGSALCFGLYLGPSIPSKLAIPNCHAALGCHREGLVQGRLVAKHLP